MLGTHTLHGLDFDILGIGARLYNKCNWTLDTACKCRSGIGKGGIVGLVARTDNIGALQSCIDSALGCNCGCSYISTVDVDALKACSHPVASRGIVGNIVGDPEVIGAIFGDRHSRVGSEHIFAVYSTDFGHKAIVDKVGCLGSIIELGCLDVGKIGSASGDELEVVEFHSTTVSAHHDRYLLKHGVARTAHHAVMSARLGLHCIDCE